MKVRKLYNNLTPLCFLPNGKLVCYQYGNLILLEEGKITFKRLIFNDLKERILGRSQLLFRLLRLGVRTAIALNNDIILMSKGKFLYEYSLKEEVFIGEHELKNNRPLSFTQISGLKGFKTGIYYGGYVTDNKSNSEICIYRRVDNSEWQTVFTFPKGSIEHVHALIPDSYQNCVWVLTGDFGEGAAIWKATNNFQKVEKAVSNSQKYRGCVAFPTKDGLIYATDAPFAKNAICLLKPNLRITQLKEIAGSCIYGCMWGDQYVFSSTVEGDGRNETLFKLLFDYRLGAGILDKYVHLYVGNLHDGFHELYKERKDVLPFIFQFGAIRFPAGNNDSRFLYFQPVATTNDLSLFHLEY